MTEELETCLNEQHRCPCGSNQFYPGPQGGLAHNIKCVECGQCYWWSPPFTPKPIDEVPGVYGARPRLLTDIG